MSRDLFVDNDPASWNLSVDGNRFLLETPIVREGFAQADADAIKSVLAVFSPAGGGFSQSSRIYELSGEWILEITGAFSRGLTQSLTLCSLEIIYRDNFAELAEMKEIQLGKMSSKDSDESSGSGCDGFGADGLLGICLLAIPFSRMFAFGGLLKR